jgi:hypothetical protein
MVVSLRVDVGSDVIAEGIKSELEFSSNIVGFGRMGTGYLNFILTFVLFMDAVFFLFLEVIVKFKCETAKNAYSERLDHRFF